MTVVDGRANADYFAVPALTRTSSRTGSVQSAAAHVSDGECKTHRRRRESVDINVPAMFDGEQFSTTLCCTDEQ
jgi:hypothetical protein